MIWWVWKIWQLSKFIGKIILLNFRKLIGIIKWKIDTCLILNLYELQLAITPNKPNKFQSLYPIISNHYKIFI